MLMWLVLVVMVPNVDFDRPIHNLLHLYDNLDRTTMIDDPNDLNVDDDGWHASLAVHLLLSNCNYMMAVVLMMENDEDDDAGFHALDAIDCVALEKKWVH